jgi:hypothetical protein
MTLEEFKGTVTRPVPPGGLSPPLLALWHDGAGNWDEAHRIAQDIEDGTGAWIHAYLHRKEGDLANAGYWYRRAGRPPAGVALEVEWEGIVEALLATG